MKKIITIVGARPQFIKAAIVSRALQKQNNLQEIIVHTGQHYDLNMSDVFFAELEIPKIDYQLINRAETHARQTGDMMIEIERILLSEKPDWLLIYGDTNSTLAGALAAAKLHIPIAHVEAGLRSYNRKMPEEVNRLVADQLAEVLFTPTKVAVNNLMKEGYALNRIVEVGDVMYDAALFYGEKAVSRSSSFVELPNEYVLVTIHRASNTDDHKNLFTIFSALELISQHLPIVLPLHPRTRKSILQHSPDFLKNTALHLIDPVGFLDMIRLEKNAQLIITDSGGVQKEAFFYQVPCVTLRDETEWTETIDLGWNRLAPPHQAENIYQETLQALNSQGVMNVYPYGIGDASERIAEYFIK